MANHQEVADILFNYIKNVIYAPDKAQLSAEELPPEYAKLVQGLNLLNDWIKEEGRFALALGNGNLNAELPSRDNHLAAPLKALYSNMQHLTWQTQEVAKGNYNQKVDFMGEFSVAFNTMTEQLRERQEKVEHSIEVISVKNAALESAAGFFRELVLLIKRVAVCFDVDGNILFKNMVAEELEQENPQIYELLLQEMKQQIDVEGRQVRLVDDYKKEYWFDIERVFLDWDSHKTYLYLADNITSEKNKEEAVEKEANEDVLTGLYNRRYAMQVLQKNYEVDDDFSLAFIDLDRLKYMNDVFGHEMGDAYITNMADILKNIGWEHMAARVGGDEFLLVVYNVDEETLKAKLEDLSTHFYLTLKDGTSQKVSFSYGVVQTNHKIGPSQLMRRADELMYEYKFSHKKKLE